MINANKIRGRIVELGYSQGTVAERMGIRQPTLSQKLNGIRPMDVQDVEKLAEILQIDVKDFGDYFFYNPVT